jgi:flap endonuclease-1
MGIQYLNTYIKHTCKKGNNNSVVKTELKDLKNKVIAIDTSIYLYRFLSENCLLENIYLMVNIFKFYNIIPIFVFDGKPPKEKLNIIEKRNRDKLEAEKQYIKLEEKLITIKDEKTKNDILESIQDLKKKFVRLKRTDIVNVRNLLDAFGVYHIEAIGEADELCARLVIKKYAYACLSEDMDLFLYGCPRVLRYLSLTNNTVIVYHLNKILEDLNLTFNEFKQICVVSGTDYNYNSSKNLNLYKILEYFQEYKNYCNITQTNKDFYTWLDDNHKCIDNIYELYNTFNMFEPSKQKIPNIKNIPLIKDSNHNKIREIMEPEGFIFLDKNINV